MFGQGRLLTDVIVSIPLRCPLHTMRSKQACCPQQALMAPCDGAPLTCALCFAAARCLLRGEGPPRTAELRARASDLLTDDIAAFLWSAERECRCLLRMCSPFVHSHFALQPRAVNSSEKTYTEYLSVARSPCLSFSLPFGQRVPCSGKCMACCFMHCIAVPKVVNVAVAPFKDEAHHSTS